MVVLQIVQNILYAEELNILHGSFKQHSRDLQQIPSWTHQQKMRKQNGPETLYLSWSINLFWAVRRGYCQTWITSLRSFSQVRCVTPFFCKKRRVSLFSFNTVGCCVIVFLCISSEIRPVNQEVRNLDSVQSSVLENFYALFSNPWRGFSLLMVPSPLCHWTVPSWDIFQDLRDQEEQRITMKEPRDLRHRPGRMGPLAPALSRLFYVFPLITA